MTKRPAKKAAKKKKAPPPAKKGPGRPSDWRPEYVEQSAKLAAMGLTHIAIADFLGVTDRTFRRWMASKPELVEALRIPEKAADDRVTLALFQLATGYDRWEEEIKVVNGEIVRVKVLRHYPPNASAGIFWKRPATDGATPPRSSQIRTRRRTCRRLIRPNPRRPNRSPAVSRSQQSRAVEDE